MNQMPRIHRLTQQPGRCRAWLSYPWLVALLLPLGCTLITDVDRSKIPEPPAIEPDPVPPDAGEARDAAVPPAETDAGNDAAAPDAPEPDATAPDAAPAADGG
jgi:hypothetical protein